MARPYRVSKAAATSADKGAAPETAKRTLAIAWRYLRRNNVWTGARLGMTHELVEKMVGHRTRLAQERREHWHTGEDQALDRYIETSQKLDRDADS